MLETVTIFLWKYLHFQDSQIISSKEQHIEIEIYCNIIHFYTDTFDQYNASIINKSAFFKKLNIVTPNRWAVLCMNQ